MATSNSVNHNPTFPIPNADTDSFDSEMLEIALSALDLDDHSLNKGPPVKRINSGTLASRPAAGNAGHVYVATDTHQLFYDNGSTWYTVVAEGVTISATGIQFTNNTGKISFVDSGGTARQAIYSTSGDTLRIYPQVSTGHVIIRNFADTLNNFDFTDSAELITTTFSVPNNTGTYRIQDSGGVARTVLQGDATDVVRFKPIKSGGHIQLRNFADAVANVDITDAGVVTALGLITGVGFTSSAGRIQGAQGANVTAANNLSLGTDGNFFTVTGNTQINLLDGTSWQAGSQVVLLFTGTPTVKHNTAVSGAFKPMILNGAVDLVAAANNTLSLVYNGTNWYETGRKV